MSPIFKNKMRTNPIFSSPLLIFPHYIILLEKLITLTLSAYSFPLCLTLSRQTSFHTTPLKDSFSRSSASAQQQNMVHFLSSTYTTCHTVVSSIILFTNIYIQAPVVLHGYVFFPFLSFPSQLFWLPSSVGVL